MVSRYGVHGVEGRLDAEGMEWKVGGYRAYGVEGKRREMG